MPGITRRDSAPRVASPPSPRSGHVVFADTLVTGVSRKLYYEEQVIAYKFEVHAAECAHYCRQPEIAAQQGRSLCPVGRALAVEVAKLMFRIRGEDEVYYKSRTNGQETHIELPTDYNNVVSLLWALQEYGHEIVRARSPTLDAVRPVSSPRSSRTPSSHTSTSSRGSYDTYTVEPTPRHSKSRRHSKSHSHDERSKRHSHEVLSPYIYQSGYPR